MLFEKETMEMFNAILKINRTFTILKYAVHTQRKKMKPSEITDEKLQTMTHVINVFHNLFNLTEILIIKKANITQF